MRDDVFAELMESANEALEHAHEKRDLRTTVLPAPPKPMNPVEVKRLRKRLSASQAVFANWLNVSTKLVQAWEGHRRKPDGPALRLLRLAETYPAVVFAEEIGQPGRADTRKRSQGRKRTAKAVSSRSR